jgi:predicted DNA-binding transcriptional regulator AlpA
MSTTGDTNTGEIVPDLINVKTLAKRLSLCERTIWGMKDSGRIPQPIYLGRAARWRVSDIAQWLTAGCPACAVTSKTPRNLRR